MVYLPGYGLSNQTTDRVDCRPMELREVWGTMDGATRQRFVRRVGTSIGYIEKLCGGHCCPSLEMAERMIAADARLSYEGFLSARRRRKRVNAKRSRR